MFCRVAAMFSTSRRSGADARRWRPAAHSCILICGSVTQFYTLRAHEVFGEHTGILPGGELLGVTKILEEAVGHLREMRFVTHTVLIGNSDTEFVAAILDRDTREVPR